MSRNVAASVRDRLLNLAQRTDINFSRLITRFGLERFLYRLSASPHANEFLLKGALLFSLWYQERNRPTRDADFREAARDLGAWRRQHASQGLLRSRRAAARRPHRRARVADRDWSNFRPAWDGAARRGSRRSHR
ncbi:nucleotidyl transferase AbiEii/AbiGii toxin family protein [Roseateles sp. L2-2]|uniref:nucleotidyl transferase AbiEii/AbiGii toxin family protein n=1 Tax=Roseateles sp. L2-2 TaxID=3422597 RepID=UPI003D35EA2D